MSNINVAAIKGKVTANITTNGIQDITGAEVAEILNDLADSSVNKTTDAALLGVSEYDPTRTYLVGMGCFKSGNLLQALVLTTGTFAAGDWTIFKTSNIPEETNLYFTNARAIASTLTGYVSGAGAITAADTILSALQKLNGNVAGLTLAQVLAVGNNANNTYISNVPYIEFGQSTVNFQNSELKYGPGAAALNWNTKILSGSHWDYDSDYSGTYTNRSLVDKGYVTAALASGVAAYLPLIGGTLSGDILFTGGKGIDTTATGGTDTMNIGATNADVINIGRAGATVNILGSALYEYAANQYVLDKLITLNYGGAVSSGAGVGFEIEENNVITGYFKTNVTRDGFVVLAPANIYGATLSLTALANDRTYTLPDASGIIALTSDLTSGYIPYTGATTNIDLGVRTLTNSSSITTPLIYGGNVANGDMVIESTSDATKTSACLFMQQTGGRVGIGLSTPPDGTLDVVARSNGSGISIKTNSATVAGAASLSFYTQANRGIGSQIFPTSTGTGGLDFYTNAATTLTMSMLSSGLVGIGTASPLSKLGIAGNLSVGATYGAIAAPASGVIIEGSVGIGTSAPESGVKLVIENDQGNAIAYLRSFKTAAIESSLRIGRARGTQAVPLAVASGDTLGGVYCQGYDGALWKTGAYIGGEVDGTVSTGIVPGRLVFYTTNTAGTLTERIRIDNSGGVGIGNAAPLSKLGITGNLSVGATYGAIAAPTSGAIIEGNVFIGTSAQVDMAWTAQDPKMQIFTSGLALPIYIKSYASGANSSPIIALGHSGSSTIGTEAALADGGTFGTIAFEGVNSSLAKTIGAYIHSTQDGAAGATYIGGKLRFFTGTNATALVENMTILGNGNIGFGVIAPTAKAHILSATEQLRVGYDVSNYYSTTIGSTGIVTLDAIGAGARFVYLDGITLAAGTTAISPLKYISGSLLATIAVGEKEYNGSYYSTNSALNRLGEGGVLFDNFADAGNVTTGKTDLYSYTTKANTFLVNGEKIEAGYGGILVGHATATRNITLAFAGTDIFDSGTINCSSTTNWDLFVTLIRVNSDTIRYKITLVVMGTAMGAIGPIVSVGTLTGLTLTGTNVLKITGTAAAAGAATNDIVAKLGTGKWFAAASN